MTHCVILLHMSQKLMSHVKVPTESEGLVAVKGRWLSETKKGCSGSPVAVKGVYGSSTARYGRDKSSCASQFNSVMCTASDREVVYRQEVDGFGLDN